MQSFNYFIHVLSFHQEDMIVSRDFGLFFEALAPLLEDPSIWCISAWNDNGFHHLVESLIFTHPP